MKINRSLSIAVICGGPSSEAEVSRSTAKGITKALQENYSTVNLIELDSNIDKNLRKLNPDVVFPAIHGQWGEDGMIQGLLTIMGLAFVGSEVEANVLAMNKILAKQIFLLKGLPVAKSLSLKFQQSTVSDHKIQEIFDILGGNIVIKPASQGSGLGVSFAHNAETLKKGLAEAFKYDSSLLLEERIFGAEITVAILERTEAEALPVIEIKTPADSWYDYQHRYTPGLSDHLIPAPLPPQQYKRVQEIALLAHQALGCRDLSRSDFVVPAEGKPILLETNTMPGMTPTSLFPDAAKAIGLNFSTLVSLLVERAASRNQR